MDIDFQNDLDSHDKHKMKRIRLMFENDRDAKTWTNDIMEQYASKHFVEVGSYGTFGLPTLDHYFFPGVKLQ